MTPALADFQRAFMQALLAPAGDPPRFDLAAQPAFAVYRNTVLKACVDALQANFPTVLQLVGETWFRSAAAEHAHAEPPRDGRLLAYGAGFPPFLDALLRQAGQHDALPYLGGVAQLDQFWREAHAAPDATPTDPVALAALPGEALARCVLAPHPAARWAWFDAVPVFAIWAGERERVADTETERQITWAGDGALITRAGDAVAWQNLDAPGCAFLDACARRLTLQAAAEGALAVEPTTDIAALLQRLLHAGALCGPASLDPSEPP